MPPTETLIAFFLATAIFAYMPGPAMLYATARTLAGGRKAGWLAAIGIHLGGYVHVIAAGLGLAVIFDLVPSLYVVLKLGGAAYLIYLGVKLLLSRDALALPDASDTPPTKRAFWESAIVEVLNPKTALFYIAFLPQFTDPAANLPIWSQLLLLGTFVNIMFSSADVICVLLADKALKVFETSRRAAKLTKRIGGSILVGLGANLALDTR